MRKLPHNVVVWIAFAALLSVLQSVDATAFHGFFEQGSQPAFTYTHVPTGTDQIYFSLFENGSRVNVFLYTLEEDAEVTIEVKADGSDFDPALVLLEAETLIVVDVDDDDKYSCNALTALGPLDSCMTNDLVAGNYLIAVTGVGGSFGKYVINLSVAFGPVPATLSIAQPKLDSTHIPPTPSPVTPPNHVFENTNDVGKGLYSFLLLPSGTDQVISQLETPDDDDVFYYILEEATTVTVEAMARGSDADMFLIILDSATYGLIDTDDDNEGDCTAISTLGEFDSCLTVDLDAGVYIIIVQSADNDKYGGYLINLSVPSGDISFALPPPTSKPPTPAPATPAPSQLPTLRPTLSRRAPTVRDPVPDRKRPSQGLSPTNNPTARATSQPTKQPRRRKPKKFSLFSGNK